ncbi:AmmeMemoRadiSam system radical SAM enzyme [Methylovirgula sp. 4M-Z18]|uniref:AmmeMemoRadiSam system radical SAM enzyme n=1 Tax=Methylovirgula sp. 4M-Z18 TaxID=2293567 RepID=UPI000E2EB09F|nr:AmmeMemoRadiSam system radical SAM enzyme [Methylovirgula sp. 4M-Z18]RFB80536.1 AmmeMemoRadiSam system radical SAM enzyme [Methylovirgula sp. 4M-Z18]
MRLVDHYTRPLPDGRIACEVCPRDCKLAPGQRGLCYVRQNIDGHMVLTTYGLSSGFCVDPIEKKPLFHFLPGSAVLSFGTAGCNLACAFCQNHEISKSREVDTSAQRASPQVIARAARHLGCRSVAYTYNDPVIFFEYAMDVAQECRAHDIKSVSVTAGYMRPKPRAEFYAHIDAANVDLKGFTEQFYYRRTASHLADVQDTLLYLRHETPVWLEITTLLIPGENDSAEEVDAMTKWLRREIGPDVPLHFTAFHPDYRMMDHPPTPKATLDRARAQALHNGLRHVYIGNYTDVARQSSICSACGTELIRRASYTIKDYRLTPEGACPACGTKLPGVYAQTAGNWGSRRLPVDIETFA